MYVPDLVTHSPLQVRIYEKSLFMRFTKVSCRTKCGDEM